MSDGRWRLVELARLGGVSPQQVRNYLDMGVLPPAGRSANGYRTFPDRHADALLATRARSLGRHPSR
ncbi:MerR family DNA-binding transcriptional regulator [Pseudonocardia sp. GCM10023141]|uniref:MerR family DNA-binding transcriptional regulator n=1 Tax=Pseudonocardia sp. GCM10023141 TaxID=3252653 RepID=UPI0036185673